MSNQVQTNQHKKGTGNVTPEEGEKMFHFWLECRQNISDTSRKFDRSLTAVRSARKRWKWAQRAEAIQRDKDKRVAKVQSKREFSDLQLCRAVQNRVLKKLLDKDFNIEAKVSDFVAVTRLIQEIEGTIGAPGYDIMRGNPLPLSAIQMLQIGMMLQAEAHTLQAQREANADRADTAPETVQ